MQFKNQKVVTGAMNLDYNQTAAIIIHSINS
jgi:hypothetical protein